MGEIFAFEQQRAAQNGRGRIRYAIAEVQLCSVAGAAAETAVRVLCGDEVIGIECHDVDTGFDEELADRGSKLRPKFLQNNGRLQNRWCRNGGYVSVDDEFDKL